MKKFLTILVAMAMIVLASAAFAATDMRIGAGDPTEAYKPPVTTEKKTDGITASGGAALAADLVVTSSSYGHSSAIIIAGPITVDAAPFAGEVRRIWDTTAFTGTTVKTFAKSTALAVKTHSTMTGHSDKGAPPGILASAITMAKGSTMAHTAKTFPAMAGG